MYIRERHRERAVNHGSRIESYPPFRPPCLADTAARSGGPIRRSDFRRRIWLPAVETSVGQPCTFHDLRHSHTALLIAQGEHPKVIQERLGTASIGTTLDTYGHLFEDLDEAATDRLESTYAVADVHAMCTREDSEVIALAAE